MARRGQRIRRWAGTVLCLVLGLFFGVSMFTFHYAEGAAYLSDDPTACINCHVMREQFDGWQKASHHAHATCNDCHVPHDTLAAKYAVKAENGFWHSYYFTFNSFHEPIRMREVSEIVVENNCRRCHDTLTSQMGIAHEAGRGEVSCLHCHASVGHGPTR